MAGMCGYSLSFGENIKADKNLNPCPFCGKQAFLQIDTRYPDDVPIKAYEVICMNVKCIIYRCDKRYYRSKKQAIEAWNRRAEDL